ncbi:MAG TPA: UDP-3-O-acyl-N-acetylglucosamine deacetylase [Elusimicrobiales bacterium]|nr:UDP-3-O-acyl-N-acetylglucosamine deacetylase [Elusimicrobiales bacterium]
MHLKTITKSFSLSGIGLHTGKKVNIHFQPSKQYGIFFKRTDLKNSMLIPARLNFVNSTVRGTSLSVEGTEIHTVEHILSTCAGLNLTAIEIHVDGPEVPILDSSAMGYVDAFKKIETKDFEDNVKTITVKEKVEYKNEDDDKVFYTAEPCDKVILNFTFLSDHPLLKHQEREFILTPANYISQIAPSRTFIFYEDIGCLRKMGLARGGSLDNAIVVTKDKFLTGDGSLHFKDEPVRHKILDLIGDLSLMGYPLKNIKISAVHGGHKHNVEFAKMLLRKGVINDS